MADWRDESWTVGQNDRLHARLERAEAERKTAEERWQSWRRAHAEAVARIGDLDARCAELRPVLDGLRDWYRKAADDNSLATAWEAYCGKTGECYTCDRMRCPECKVCPVCSGDGHAEHCSRTDDEDVGQP